MTTAAPPEPRVTVEGLGTFTRSEAIERLRAIAAFLANNPENVQKWSEGRALAERIA